MRIYTIGHSSLNLADFISQLQESGVDWVADVRSSPYSGRFPHFNRQSLVRSLKEQGIRYFYVGDRLGGKPNASEIGDWTQGRVSSFVVSRLSESDGWQAGLKELTETILKMAERGETGCLLCSEADPNACHRSMVGFGLQDVLPELEVLHLLPEGGTVPGRFQKTLFVMRDGKGDYH